MTIYGYVCDYPEPKGKIYFVRDGLGHIKIGIAKNVKKRLEALQTSNPMKLDVYMIWTVNDINDAKVVEKELHDMFAQYRLQGEWFEEEPVMDYLQGDGQEVFKYKFMEVEQ